MSSVPTALLGRSTEASTTRIESLGLYRAALWVLLGANLLAGWGVQWDIMWHVLIGRDSFWIPPHVMTYGGVTLIVLASFGVLARDTLRRLLAGRAPARDRKSTRLNSSHVSISYAVFCLKKKKNEFSSHVLRKLNYRLNKDRL